MLLTLVLIAATAQLAPGAWVDSPAPLLAAPTALPPVDAPANEGTIEGTFSQRVTALDLALSMLVTEKPSTWRFEALRREADALRALAGTEAEKAQLQGLTSRIETFSRLARRFRQSDDQLAGWRAAGATRGSNDPLATRPTPGLPSTAGILRPVVSQRPDAPKYAVIDDNGQIAALVTPTPAIEAQLRGMVGRRVGVEGQRDFRSDLRRDHVVAERVTPLDTLRR